VRALWRRLLAWIDSEEDDGPPTEVDRLQWDAERP
jgi:hypothetical protein